MAPARETTTTAASATSSTTTTTTTGGGETCDPSTAKTDCDTCVFTACCLEAGACNPSTPCDAFVVCADAAGCFEEPADFLTCATNACPAEATNGAVSAYDALSACVKSNCEAPCGL